MRKMLWIGAAVGGLVGLISLLLDGAFNPSTANAGQLGETIGFVIGRVGVSVLLGVVIFGIFGGLLFGVRRIVSRGRGRGA